MRLPLSAKAPSHGAITASTKLETPLAIASQKVLVVASCPAARYCLKNSGKNTTITVVANAEFAQSYRAQANTFFSNNGDFTATLRAGDG